MPAPLNHGCHCESLIGSQANWDLAKRLIAFEFGGDIYAEPPGPDRGLGLAVHGPPLVPDARPRRVVLLGDRARPRRGRPTAAASTTGSPPTASSTTTTAISPTARRTPASSSRPFDLHAIACGSGRPIPRTSRPGCPAPLAAPALSACGTKAPVQLNWTASAGATRVPRPAQHAGLRLRLHADRHGRRRAGPTSRTPRSRPASPTTTPSSRWARTQSCYGQASNCVAVTPTTCARDHGRPPPTGVDADARPADNQVRIVAGTPSPAPAPTRSTARRATAPRPSRSQAIARRHGPGDAFLDTDGLARPADVLLPGRRRRTRRCASCASAPSACMSRCRRTGACLRSAGLRRARHDLAPRPKASAGSTSQWPPATAHCAGHAHLQRLPLDRSRRSFPRPRTHRLRARPATRYSDSAVVRRHALLLHRPRHGRRREHGRQLVDGSARRPVGTLTPGTYSDNAGDTGSGEVRPGHDRGLPTTRGRCGRTTAPTTRPRSTRRPRPATTSKAAAWAWRARRSSSARTRPSPSARATTWSRAGTAATSRSRPRPAASPTGPSWRPSTTRGHGRSARRSGLRHAGLRRRPAGLHRDLGCGLCQLQRLAVGVREPARPHPLPVQLGRLDQPGRLVHRQRRRSPALSFPGRARRTCARTSPATTAIPAPMTPATRSMARAASVNDDTNSCSDGNACTSGDACSAGTCSGTPVGPPTEVGDSVRASQSGTTSTISWSDEEERTSAAFRGPAGGREPPRHWTSTTILGKSDSRNNTQPIATPTRFSSTFYYLVAAGTGHAGIDERRTLRERPCDEPCRHPGLGRDGDGVADTPKPMSHSIPNFSDADGLRHTRGKRTNHEATTRCATARSPS